MPVCPSCGAERIASAIAGEPCAKCGAAGAAAPELELSVPRRPPPRPAAAPKKKEDDERTLELAVDPRSLISQVEVAPEPRPLVRAGAGPLASRPDPGERAPTVGDVAFDATLLAEYGAPPRHWIFAPLYALRVLRRQRELKKVLVGRREEAARAAHEVEDALVAFAERARPTAEKHAEFAAAIEELRGTEEVLRSRDRVLATEQDAQSARLASVDARLAKLEAELAKAQTDERNIASEMASAQAALARGETKLKRAESELRSAQQRDTDETHA
jgi:hypothetical protein